MTAPTQYRLQPSKSLSTKYIVITKLEAYYNIFSSDVTEVSPSAGTVNTDEK